MEIRLLTAAVFLFVSFPLFAIRESGDGGPWNVHFKTKNKYELKVRAELPKGSFLLNLGPTGIRAKIEREQPDRFIVKYVFQDELSPARGKIHPGDVIIGANDKTFEKEHIFGRYGKEKKSWNGPIMELSKHIEDSQSKDGVLKLIVLEQGDKLKKKHVEIQLKAVGAFAKTYPWNCPRSEKRAKEICDLIAETFDSKTMHIRGPHASTHAILALMAHGYKEHESTLKNYVKRRENFTASPWGGGFSNWHVGFAGVLLGEYSLLYKTDQYKGPMKSIAASHLQTGWRGGLFTHRSILNIHRQGSNPYAAIAGIAGLNMLSCTLFKKGGYDYSPHFYNLVHLNYLNSTGTPGTDNGNIAYGFKNGADRGYMKRKDKNYWAVIKLKNDKQALSGKGPGYVVPDGMKDITDYEIYWPKKGHAYIPYPEEWLKKERHTNIVIESVDGLRYIYQNNPKLAEKNNPEPKKPFETKRGGSHSFPVGLGAAIHLIDNEQRPSWIHLGNHLADTCALSYEHTFDGHGGGQLHGFWTVVGAGMAKEELRRKYLDYMKCFLIMSETHYGSMILQPWGRDRGVTSDVWYGAQILPLSTAAILLSLPKERLQITGAYRKKSKTASASKTDSVVFKVRPAKLDSEQISKLDTILLGTLMKMSKNNEIKPVAIKITKSDSNVVLKKVNGNFLMFQSASDKSKIAMFSFPKLSDIDRANLSLLIAVSKPESKIANALASFYLENFGTVRLTNIYLSKTSEEHLKKIEELVSK